MFPQLKLQVYIRAESMTCNNYSATFINEEQSLCGSLCTQILRLRENMLALGMYKYSYSINDRAPAQTNC